VSLEITFTVLLCETIGADCLYQDDISTPSSRWIRTWGQKQSRLSYRWLTGT